MEALAVVHEGASGRGRRPKTSVSDENGSKSTESRKSSPVKNSPENGKRDPPKREHTLANTSQERRLTEKHRRKKQTISLKERLLGFCA
ncbi:PREDICTED: LOW QUALITY PROTEIN: uncharacterized protein LOC109127266 [Camelina sativa]|uniref:LOW QUALITY PROTEIN: uncharacterized protein LOC109127266 n=1 Tax=Camelina sativa TaxID=90675 RepID=A0ABM1QKU5_CAMSA|nr:PREDICTED: LOW QUALITY PROTEIN: uncharacterized protein LOC109127266 [Camelina sativa]